MPPSRRRLLPSESVSAKRSPKQHPPEEVQSFSRVWKFSLTHLSPGSSPMQSGVQTRCLRQRIPSLLPNPPITPTGQPDAGCFSHKPIQCCPLVHLDNPTLPPPRIGRPDNAAFPHWQAPPSTAPSTIGGSITTASSHCNPDTAPSLNWLVWPPTA